MVGVGIPAFEQLVPNLDWVPVLLLLSGEEWASLQVVRLQQLEDLFDQIDMVFLLHVVQLSFPAGGKAGDVSLVDDTPDLEGVVEVVQVCDKSGRRCVFEVAFQPLFIYFQLVDHRPVKVAFRSHGTGMCAIEHRGPNL